MIPAVLFCAACIVLGLVPPRLRVPAIAADALPIFVVAFLSRLAASTYPGTTCFGRRLASAGIGPGLSPFVVVYLVPTTVSVCLSVLWVGADRR